MDAEGIVCLFAKEGLFSQIVRYHFGVSFIFSVYDFKSCTLSQQMSYSTWNSNLNPYSTWNSNPSLAFNLEFQFQWG